MGDVTFIVASPEWHGNVPPAEGRIAASGGREDVQQGGLVYRWIVRTKSAA
jgi:hypothetical protein